MARQTWRRLGLVFSTGGEAPWIASHASYPTPLPVADQFVRVYFSPRDADNRSSIASLEIALDGDRFFVVSPPRGPLLSPGPRGAFDDSGVSVGSVVADGETVRVWYLGWNLGVTVPFRNFIGLATGARDEALERVSPAPVLDRSAADPYCLGYPWVIRNANSYRMWYGSHLEWGVEGLAMRHAIKAARSADGIIWQRDGLPILSPRGDGEFALSRPSIIKDSDRFRMWYARRYPTYRLGYAESEDGEKWVRRDDALRFVGTVAEWEGETMCYPAVFDWGARRYMLYNGDGYGRTGFGLAILEDAGG
jgi:hypothetical protein